MINVASNNVTSTYESLEDDIVVIFATSAGTSPIRAQVVRCPPIRTLPCSIEVHRGRARPKCRIVGYWYSCRNHPGRRAQIRAFGPSHYLSMQGLIPGRDLRV